jgi:hypothetical protein
VLQFVERNPRAFAEACQALGSDSARTILFQRFNAFAAEAFGILRDRWPEAVFLSRIEQGGGALPDGVGRAESATAADVVVICEDGADAVSPALMECLDLTSGTIIAPVTDRYFARNPVFMISVPKSGTHLLLGLIEALGYQAGGWCGLDPAPATWYCLDGTNPHTSAAAFFTEISRRDDVRERGHPFAEAPAVFIYRNPLDVVVSEARYFSESGPTPFTLYLSRDSFEDRLMKLITDQWLLGTIRDRVSHFLAWAELDNVVPVSFEELVGPKGGGSEAVQLKVIWSLQLKLHVPGSPRQFAARLFDPNSPTFHAGQIGGYQRHFTDAAYKAFYSLPRDFMTNLGFSDASRDHVVRVPARADEFMRRPLRFSKNPGDVPRLVRVGYRHSNIVWFRRKYYAVPQELGIIRLGIDPIDEYLRRRQILVGSTFEEIKDAVDTYWIRGMVRMVLAEIETAAKAKVEIAPKPQEEIAEKPAEKPDVETAEEVS